MREREGERETDTTPIKPNNFTPPIKRGKHTTMTTTQSKSRKNLKLSADVIDDVAEVDADPGHPAKRENRQHQKDRLSRAKDLTRFRLFAVDDIRRFRRSDARR